MTACLVPVCDAQSLDLGVWAFLCLEHALEAHTGRRAAPERLDLRGRCWGEGLSCTSPATTVTAGGTFCATHAPMQPRPAERHVDDTDERAGQLATLAVLNAFPGSRVEAVRPNLQAPIVETIGAPLRLRYLYGSTEDVPPAEIPRGVKAFANAATAGRWDFRVLRAVRHDRVLLRAWRGSLLLLAWWDGGKFGGAGLQHSRGMPMDLNATQATRLLRAG